MSDFAPRLQKQTVSGSRAGDLIASVLARNFGEHQIEYGTRPSDVGATLGLCSLGKIKLFYGFWHSPLRIRAFDSQMFMETFPLSGISETVNNGVARTASPSKGAVFEPGATEFAPTQDYEHLVALFDPCALSSTLSALTGSPAIKSLKLDRADFDARPQSRLSRSLVKMLVEELGAKDSVPSSLVLAELEQALIVAFLCNVSHNYSGALRGRADEAAPWQVRRVEEYIEANWDQPIAIEALAVVAHLSARSIFHSFKKYRGYSPMSFVKSLRLRNARKMLSDGSLETTVTEVAFACGFGNLGHFASDYKRAFGEAPSTTSSRTKSGAPVRR